MLSNIAFVIGLVAALGIGGLSSLRFVKKDFEFWPPPSPKSWQHKTFRIIFRIFLLCLVVLSVTEFEFGSPGHLLLGGALFIIGFGLALKWTGFLGWHNAFGEAKGLKSEGPFAWSRNPIYVVSIIGMIGWALIVDSTFLSILLGLWSLLYICAPFLEEPWLERQYGAAFTNYMKKVPRFVGRF